jgi:hypothetical protein
MTPHKFTGVYQMLHRNASGMSTSQWQIPFL